MHSSHTNNKRLPRITGLSFTIGQMTPMWFSTNRAQWVANLTCPTRPTREAPYAARPGPAAYVAARHTSATDVSRPHCLGSAPEG